MFRIKLPLYGYGVANRKYHDLIANSSYFLIYPQQVMLISELFSRLFEIRTDQPDRARPSNHQHTRQYAFFAVG